MGSVGYLSDETLRDLEFESTPLEQASEERRPLLGYVSLRGRR